ncbi:unnamed protein product [Cylicocyclus nassatus]|uniref:Uncharacterized protein n=1 Tax=Cylicocyclus nassatus TaxID=53992 RepID=A0AA36GTA2_CYLNA|nr:unnamed protein product [Cylicocyclus nassatus]
MKKILPLTQDYHHKPVPNWFRSNKRAIYSIIDRVYSFIVGVNDYHDIDLLRVKQGYFLYTITEDLWKQWIDYEQTGKIRKKFRAYVTDNWLMLAFLHALGCGTSALGKSLPRNNPLIMIELYQGSGIPLVKVFYKDDTMDVPKDVTIDVRDCSFEHCHLVEFVIRPRFYKTNDSEKACFSTAKTRPKRRS